MSWLLSVTTNHKSRVYNDMRAVSNKCVVMPSVLAASLVFF